MVKTVKRRKGGGKNARHGFLFTWKIRSDFVQRLEDGESLRKERKHVIKVRAACVCMDTVGLSLQCKPSVTVACSQAALPAPGEARGAGICRYRKNDLDSQPCMQPLMLSVLLLNYSWVSSECNIKKQLPRV